MPGLNLTKEEAAVRSSQITVYSYEVAVDLTYSEDHFTSWTKINFDAADTDSTFVDLVASQIRFIKLNGNNLDPAIYRDNRIELMGLEDHNVLEVDAICDYMHTGEGMHRFVDKADGQAYVYTQFEVPDARRVFAVFEQPDMKATFKFTVTAPDHWKVFSNAPTPQPVIVGPGKATWYFEPTEQVSSYITAIVAGPYQGEESSLVSSDGRTIALGAYCRASLVEYLDAENIFDITRQGFAYYENTYGHPYPFRKYDQIFVPEYNAGAMENAGCVTFRDEYLFRSRPTGAQLESRANTILHELAHMWFGDLVTMKWWNDLWLNESFAEYMSHAACAEGTQFTDAWTAFGMRKLWGLSQDQLSSTHPIVAEIRDLQDVEVNFDGITYAKGASVLRQLVAWVGKDAFVEGVRRYIEKNQWKNATLADLLAELEAASGRDLKSWAKVWLEEAGVTLLRPVIEEDEDGVITSFEIKQELVQEGTSLRPHRLVVSGYDLVDGKATRTLRAELDVQGAATEVSEFIGRKRPALVLVNDEDFAYAKVRLDEKSLSWAKLNIAAFTDSLPRSLILASAWDMTRDGEMEASDFVKLALTALPAEENSTTITLLANQIRQATTSYCSPQRRRELTALVSENLLRLAQVAPAGSDTQQILIKAACNVAIDPQLGELRSLYLGQTALMGLDLDADMRWSMLTPLVAAGALGEEHIDALEKEDATMTGARKAAGARAALTTAQAKEAAWSQIYDTATANATLVDIMVGFNTGVWRHPQLLEDYVDRYFQTLEDTWERFTFHMASEIVEMMFPLPIIGLGNVDVVAKATQWLADHPQANSALRRLISEGLDDAKRIVKAQSL